jgi:hypothetical protein
MFGWMDAIIAFMKLTIMLEWEKTKEEDEVQTKTQLTKSLTCLCII